MCHDTRGHIWMDEREQKQLGIILDGAVKDDSLVQQRNYRYARLLYEFWRKDVDLFPAEILVRRGNTLATKPHAVIFVFDGSMEEIPDGEEETRFYREIIQMLRAKGYLYPQVVLTRIDRVEENLVQAASHGDAGEDAADPELRLRQVLDRKIEDVVVKLGVPRGSVHFIENYSRRGTWTEAEGTSPWTSTPSRSCRSAAATRTPSSRSRRAARRPGRPSVLCSEPSGARRRLGGAAGRAGASSSPAALAHSRSALPPPDHSLP
ncbi:unnamed protein product, partial [Prorocentrum cordatum]